MTGIISRAAWGARFDRGFGPAPLPAQRLYLHHSVTVAPDLRPPFDDDDAAVRTLEAIGEQRFGGGISYTYVVTPTGRIYEGHGIDRRGAHTKGHNSVARAICWIGDYDEDLPTAQMVDATAWLVRHGFEQKWWTAPRITGGHRDAPGASTACPGKYAYRLIGDINRAASRPAAPPAPPATREDDHSVNIDFTFYSVERTADNEYLRVNDEGLIFRASCTAEVGANSSVIEAAWVRWAAHWGRVDWRIVFWDDHSPIGEVPDPNRRDNWPIPAACRSFTLQGEREHAGVTLAAQLLQLPK